MARMMKSRHHDGVDPNWFHFDCFWPKAKGWGLNAGEIEKIKGVDALRFEDQERVEKACNAITDIRESFKLFSTQVNCFTAKFMIFFGPGTVDFGRWMIHRGSLLANPGKLIQKFSRNRFEEIGLFREIGLFQAQNYAIVKLTIR